MEDKYEQYKKGRTVSLSAVCKNTFAGCLACPDINWAEWKTRRFRILSLESFVQLLVIGLDFHLICVGATPHRHVLASLAG